MTALDSKRALTVQRSQSWPPEIETAASLRAVYRLAPRPGLEPGTCGLTVCRGDTSDHALSPNSAPQFSQIRGLQAQYRRGGCQICGAMRVAAFDPLRPVAHVESGRSFASQFFANNAVAVSAVVRLRPTAYSRSPSQSPHGQTRMIVFPWRRPVELKAPTASSRVETMPMFVRSR